MMCVVGCPQATLSSYANLTALQNLPAATIGATATTVNQAGPNGADRLPPNGDYLESSTLNRQAESPRSMHAGSLKTAVSPK